LTLTEAIEVVKPEILERPLPHEEEYNNALKLLIKAGKREQANRANPDYVLVGLLPGETKE